ncbi:MAG TPA: TetR/AcrR family transcriptional regulator [Caulobacteraceae bacterium]
MGALKNKRETNERGISTEDWLDVARETLIQEGIGAVKIDRLAKKAGVTRGGFYYRFKSHKALLEALLDDWRATNNRPMLDAINGPGTPSERYWALVKLWIEERDYRPDYDTAVRAWAREAPKVAAVVHQVDDERIEALHGLFLDAGYDELEATTRARVSYFHQVGYYAMGVKESAKSRKALTETYYRVLTGFRGGELGRSERAPDAAKVKPGAPSPQRRKSRPL